MRFYKQIIHKTSVTAYCIAQSRRHCIH